MLLTLIGHNRATKRVSRMTLTILVCLGCMGLANSAWGQYYYYQNQQIQLAPQSDELIAELDGTRTAQEIMIDLAEEGFPTATQMQGTPGTLNLFRVAVDEIDPETRVAIGNVAGIRAVRDAYNVVSLEKLAIPTGQIVVKFEAGTPLARAQRVVQSYGASIDRAIDGLDNVYLLNQVDESQTNAVDLANALYLDPETVYCHPSFLMQVDKHQASVSADPTDSGINDPFYSFQWHLNNNSQLTGGVVDADVDAPEAWTLTQGSGAIVGVIDDAVNWNHEDLIDNYLTGYDFADDDNDPNPGEGIFGSNEAHGTAVTGIICARANDIGVRGVAPLAQFIACRSLSAWAQDTALAEGFLFSARNGAMAINNSWGGGLPTDVLTDAITEVTANGRGGKGVLVLFSSGNEGSRIPASSYINVIEATMGIGATMRDDKLSCYSSYGPRQSVVAPGGGMGVPADGAWGVLNLNCYDSDITTTDVMDSLGLPGTGYNPPGSDYVSDYPNVNYTSHMNGTSAACPMVTGVAALVFSVNPSLRAEEVRNIIEHTADREEITLRTNVVFDGVTGHDELYGHGRVNAYNAAKAAQDGKTWPSPIKDIQKVATKNLVQLFWTNPEHDVDGILVVRGNQGMLNWHPIDGLEYTVGQQVASGVIVVANDNIDSLEQPNLAAGDYEYGFFVRNVNGYYSWGRATGISASSTVSVPKASVRATPTVGAAPLSVHFAGGAIDADVRSLSYSWDFDDGQTQTGPAVDHIFTDAGEYMVRLTVTNGSGQTASATQRIVVTDEGNLNPSAEIAATPTSGQAPLVVLFEAAATDLDGFIVDYRWDFNDGTTATGQIVEHVFLEPGTYGVTLSATDDRGGIGTDIVLINAGATPATAADTDPPNVLDPPLTAPCGAGVAQAALASIVALLAVGFVHRRR